MTLAGLSATAASYHSTPCMEKQFFEEQTFEHLNLGITPLAPGNYEGCTFLDCDFTNAVLSQLVFADCTFISCNLSMVKSTGTGLRKVRFEHCKLLGFRFDTCAELLFEVEFVHCTLDFASFYGKKMKGTRFSACTLCEADFTQADLTQAVFASCDLERTVFEETTLIGTDFRTATQVVLDPEKNKLKGARFSTANALGLLYKYQLSIE